MKLFLLITHLHPKPTTTLTTTKPNDVLAAQTVVTNSFQPPTMTSEPYPSTSSTTRICIKNLPPSFNESKLKQHLHSNIPSLVLTDCKMLKTKDGRSRKIAFVGFKNSEVRLLYVYIIWICMRNSHH